jgi:hypothetical protein
LPGDGWRTRHDAIKHLLHRDLRDHGLPCSCEVFGLFAPLLPQRARDELASSSQRKRQGLVPDFMATLPEGFEVLLELKVIGLASTWYSRGDAARGCAVAARARAIQSEYIGKARTLDRRFSSQDNAATTAAGPVERKLAGYGRVRGLTFGAFGEASKDVHELVGILAKAHASRHWITMGCRNPEEAVALTARTLFRSWGLMAVRAQACLKLSGLAHVGTGNKAASGRRETAAALHARLREAYQCHWSGRV